MRVAASPIPPIHGSFGRVPTFGILSSYPPTACGLATFTAALSDGLSSHGADVRVVRVADGTGAASSRVIGELQRRFPRNRLLWLEAGSTALRAGRPADANASLEEGLARLSHDPRPRAFGEDARWRYAHGAALVGLGNSAAAERELRAALAGATRDWVRGRVHKELGKLADLAGDRPRALAEYRLADRLCRQDRDGDCSDEVKKVMKAGYR